MKVNMRKLLILFLASIFILACSEENGFMKHSEETLVINIVKDSIFINGETVATLSQDLYGKDLLVKPIESYVRSKARSAKNVHIRFNTGDAYDTFYKIAATLGFMGTSIDNVQFIIGESYKTPIHVSFTKRPNECENGSLLVKLFLKGDKLSKEEFEQTQKKIEECRLKYLNTTVTFEDKNGNIQYTLGASKKGFQIFKTEEEVMNAIESIQMQEDIQNKVDKDVVTFVTSRTIPMGQIASILTRLQEKKLSIKFAFSGT